ncbi:NADP-binding protein [Dacryopinax primogenitus]|uniref:NADP-binding protein n=1 Tax=Dacryopinax primogenitus (strain DJM 731) TaxID=1858805 RepID=M5GD91_DACPD|nr:NADP-binding protein [Dacryopinax primogenitus]EJU06665.1 NADP-binding protein [Dacryopinax primogenitus]
MDHHPVVLVTGVNGFLASAVTLELVRHAFRVKGTVRSQAKADAFLAKYPHTAQSITFVVLPVLDTPGAFDTAMEGVDYVLHLATPIFFGFTDNEKEMLRPAIEGTLGLLRSAARHPRVKHVTMTSSFAAVERNGFGRPGRTYTAEDWNDTTYDEAAKVPPGSDTLVYTASKALAEKAAWRFIKDRKPQFGFTTFCPPMIYGPPLQPFDTVDQLNFSCAELWEIMCGKQQDLSSTPWPQWIDVRDLAGFFSYSQVAHILATAFPEQAPRIARSDNTPPDVDYRIDSCKVKKDFGLTFTTLEKCVTDMAKVLYAKERQCRT